MSAPQFNSVRPGIAKNGLYHYYDVGNISSYSGSGTTIVDLMGHMNQDSGTTVFSGTAGAKTSSEYFTYNGSNYWDVTAPTGSFVRTIGRSDVNFTIDGWMYSTVTSSTPMFANRADASNGCQWGASYGNSTGADLMYLGPSVNVTSTLVSSGSAQWRYYAASCNPAAGTVTFFRGDVSSGVQTQTVSYTPEWSTGESADIFRIGRIGGSVFAGSGHRISIWRMYNRTLTSSELKNNFFAERARFGV